MRMILKSLHMENFKGIKSLDVNFSNKTSIKGQNAVGKTTIFDAFTWLLFNKNSAGEEKFNVRPLDKDGHRIDNVEIKVVGVIDVDGKEVELSRFRSRIGLRSVELIRYHCRGTQILMRLTVIQRVKLNLRLIFPVWRRARICLRC